MAGYIIYSLDWGKFQNFVNNPTEKQLQAFGKRVSENMDGYDEEFEDEGPAPEWPKEGQELQDLVTERLARPDWYGDLSDAGKDIWSQAVWGFCCHTSPNSVGFRADHDGVYWDVIELAWQQLKVAPNQISPDVALSAFGTRPYRYRATKGDSAWQPMHSMHTPDEVRKMLKELESTAPAIEASKNKQAMHDYDALIQVLEKLAEEGRMLFIQVDT